MQSHVCEPTARCSDSAVAIGEGVDYHRLDHWWRLLVALVIRSSGSFLTLALSSLGEQLFKALPAERWRPGVRTAKHLEPEVAGYVHVHSEART